MPISIEVVSFHTTEFIDITDLVQKELHETGISDGLVVVYIPHTTAAVTINEAADPAVREDIMETINELVPWERVYGHSEGNSPAHIKASLIGSSETIILENGHLQLGRWQGIYLCEFDGPRNRKVMIKIIPG